MDYKEKYEQALERVKECAIDGYLDAVAVNDIFPELKESDDERIRRQTLKVLNYYKDEEKSEGRMPTEIEECIAWLEKQDNEPNWCHHEVDLSGCSEEYRKAYYDGWNNCNMQHSQCRSELDDVVKCLINGMKFYYEDNEEATWGTDKWSMPVKHIIEVLEKQVGQKPYGQREECSDCQSNYAGECKGYCGLKRNEQKDKRIIDNLISQLGNLYARKLIKKSTKDKYVNWLKSLRLQSQWKPSEGQLKVLKKACDEHWEPDGLDPLYTLYQDLKKLKEE